VDRLTLDKGDLTARQRAAHQPRDGDEGHGVRPAGRRRTRRQSSVTITAQSAMARAETAHQGQNDWSTKNSPYLSQIVNARAGQISAARTTVGQRASAQRGWRPAK